MRLWTSTQSSASSSTFCSSLRMLSYNVLGRARYGDHGLEIEFERLVTEVDAHLFVGTVQTDGGVEFGRVHVFEGDAQVLAVDDEEDFFGGEDDSAADGGVVRELGAVVIALKRIRLGRCMRSSCC